MLTALLNNTVAQTFLAEGCIYSNKINNKSTEKNTLLCNYTRYTTKSEIVSWIAVNGNSFFLFCYVYVSLTNKQGDKIKM